MTFNSTKLANGLNLLTYPMPHIQSVSINIIINVGSRYESVDETGISHFLEHMAFKGTKNRTALEIAKEFDSIGGHFNAYTGRENTVFYAKILSQHTKKAVEILADILQNSLFKPEDIEKERSVIHQEIAAVKDNPDELMFDNLYSEAFKNQPIGRSILGSYDNISRFNKTSFEQYINKHYTSDNIYISFAGNINEDKLISLVEGAFDKLRSGSLASYEKANYSGGIKILQKDLEQTTMALAFESTPYNNLEEFYHTQILSIILGGGVSSRLFQKIREEHGLVYGIGSGVNAFSDTGIFSICAATDHKNVIITINKIIQELHKIQYDISEEELKIAKEQIKSNIYMAEEKNEYKSEEIGKNFALFKKYFSPKEVIEFVENTQIYNLKDSANRIFTTMPTLSAVGDKLDRLNFSDIYNNFKK